MKGLCFGVWLGGVLVFHTLVSSIFSPEFSSTVILPFAIIFAVGLYWYEKNRKFRRLPNLNNILNENLNGQKFKLDSNGNYRILPTPKSQHEILVRLKGWQHRQQLKLQYIAINANKEYFFCGIDQFGNEILFNYNELSSLIGYEGKTYHTIDDFIRAACGKSAFWAFNKLRTKYFAYLDKMI
ncbi:hypothetical protein [Rodentibacter caecimuris]|uniref:hypothetical protein n=1 Tax=Rodentibacter caecimuris TaxID=1796644 RepID=UPI000985FFFB|nr:hypothetical protein BKG97_09260 [Rodentibacter heylii]